MKDRVRITDVSPRDGLQNEAGVIATADKVRLVELLCAAGVDEVEVTSFVSPKWVPQLGDSGEVMRGVGLLPLPEGGDWGVGSVVQGQAERWSTPPKQPITESRARELRASMTKPERALWRYLRQREVVGAKFRRQHPFGPYILDFFCQEKLLALEIDGRTHRNEEAERHDSERDAWVAGHGVRTIRVAQGDVIRNARGVAETIREIVRDTSSRGSRPPTPQPPPSGRGSRTRPLFSALVPNERGLAGALDANRLARSRLLSKVSVFTAASETFSQRNTNASIAETIERFGPVVAGAHAEDLDVRAYVSCAIACPFEGPISPAKVLDVVDMLMELDVDEIDLGDTIGAGTPESVSALLGEYEKRYPTVESGVPLTLHFHDTFGRAAECVRVALEMGVRSFDGSVAGLGGCPYASTKLPDGSIQRAPGNISTELLVETIEAAGYETGVDRGALGEAAAFARGIVARSRGM